MIEIDKWIIGEEVIDSTLRSALLFNSKSDKIKLDDIFQKAVLAIIIEKDKEGITPESLISSFSARFNRRIEISQLTSAISSLESKSLVYSDADGKVFYNQSLGETVFWNRLKEDTDALVFAITSLAKEIAHNSGVFFDYDRVFIKDNVLRALSVYLNQFSYSYFGVKEPADKSQLTDAVQVAKRGLKGEEGEILVMAISDKLANLSPSEIRILEQWARAYVTSAVLGIDPMLQSLRASKMQGKSFILDTDVVLNCITDNAKYSKIYNSMIRRLQLMGCKVFIPSEVLDEVRNHADAAKKRYYSTGPSILSFSDDILETEVCNVFIDDYVHKYRSSDGDGPYEAFSSYLDNLFDPRYPELLMDEINARFKSKVTILDDIDIPETDQVVFEEFANECLSRTNATEKAWYRRPEDNERISRTDAKLYFYVYRTNGQTSASDFLSSKMYLLTRTTRSARAAAAIGYEKVNIICNPDALMAVIMETNSSETGELLNLFENPFLAYTGDRIWSQIQPLIAAGAEFKTKNIRWLHRNYNDKLDQVLTASSVEEKVAAYNRLEKTGLKGIFNEAQIVNVYEQNKKLKIENEDLSGRVEQLEKLVGDLTRRIEAKPEKRARNGNAVVKTKRKRKS